MMTAIDILSLLKARNISWLFFLPALFLIDFYVYKGLQRIAKTWKFLGKKISRFFYWDFCSFLISGMLFATYTNAVFGIRMLMLLAFFFFLLLKVCFIPFVCIDDMRIYLFGKFKKKDNDKKGNNITENTIDNIPRSQFLLKAGLLAGTIPLAALRLNMKSGLYDYQIKRQTLYLPNLPKAFDGLKIGQISDLHAGNFRDMKAVNHGVEQLMDQKADIVFFTGDLVDAYSHEFNHYFNVFKQIKAPLGVYSSLGNHDYGDYGDWSSLKARNLNFKHLLDTHKHLGWDLLRNENRRVRVNNEEIGILGVENWGEYSWIQKYGNIDLAAKNTADLPVKLLLSHDPTHWRAQVIPKQPNIDVMFAGHTHGMQLGVRIPDFQWSPVQYIYNEWAGLYLQGKQQLYVNVGFGFLAVEGRVGILPEITIFELKASGNPNPAIS